MKNLKNILAIAIITIAAFSCKNESQPEIKTVDTEVEITKAELDPNATYAKAEFKIEGMTCEMGCAKTIEKKIAKMEGVKSATVDFKRELAMVEYDEAKVTLASLESTVVSVADMYKIKDMKTVEAFSAKKACSVDCKKACCTGKKECAMKCKTDCTKKDCADCKAKTAECKKKCASKTACKGKTECKTKCKADCTKKDCADCKAKTAECKKKCAAKTACKGKTECKTKCKADCTKKDCADCKAKTAECKKKCAAKTDAEKTACAKDCKKACCAKEEKA